MVKDHTLWGDDFRGGLYRTDSALSELLLQKGLEVLFYKFCFTRVLHLFTGLAELYPHDGFIMQSRMFRACFMYPVKADLFPSKPIAYEPYIRTDMTIIESCLFLEFSECSCFTGLSSFDPSLREHDASILMEDTEDFFFSLSFTQTYTSCAAIKPKKGSNFFLPLFQKSFPFFAVFHFGDYRYFSENRKKFA